MDLARESKLGKEIQQLNLLSPKHCLLAVYLLYESKVNSKSKWIEYIKMLPSDYSNFPIFFKDKELEFLNGSPILNQIKEKLSDLKSDYNEIINNTSFSKLIKNSTFEDFCKMRMAVSSRVFGIKTYGRKTDCLCPLADMINHKRPRQTQWYFSDNLDSFVMQAIDDIEEGCEIFDSYGKKCNSRFFLNYGFIIRNNESNEYPFSLEDIDKKLKFYSTINTNDDNLDNFENLKIEEKKSDQELMKIFRLKCNLDDQVFDEFLSYIRKSILIKNLELTLKPTEVSVILRELSIIKEKEPKESESESPNVNVNTNSNTNYNMISSDNYSYDVRFYFIKITGPISLENEICCLKFLLTLIKSANSKYPTTLNQDLEIININTNLTENEINCILMRMSEKKVLEFFREFCEFTLDFIENLDLKQKSTKNKRKMKNVKKMLQENYEIQNFLPYFENVLFKLINDLVK